MSERRFYGAFYAELPDQFVEAEYPALARCAKDWDARLKSRFNGQWQDVFNIAGMVARIPLKVSGRRSEGYPTISLLHLYDSKAIDQWLQANGGDYSGRYWETFAQDQRGALGKPGDAGRGIAAGQSGSGAIQVAAGSPFNTFRGPSGISARDLIRAKQRLLNANYYYDPTFDERPPPPLKRDGVVAGEIVGFRCWRLSGGLLHSVYQNDVWLPGQVLAGRELQDWDQRGVHAWKDAASKHYHDYIRSYLNRDGTPFQLMAARLLYGTRVATLDDLDAQMRPAMVTGTIFMWGDVVEHERGYRAEYARVRSLDWLYPDASMMGREQQTLDRLRDAYGVAGRASR